MSGGYLSYYLSEPGSLHTDKCNAIRLDHFLCSDVVLVSVSMAPREDDSFLNQIREKQTFPDFYQDFFFRRAVY